MTTHSDSLDELRVRTLREHERAVDKLIAAAAKEPDERAKMRLFDEFSRESMKRREKFVREIRECSRCGASHYFG